MHETGLCEGVLAVVRDVSQDEPVSRIRLRVGRLQGVVPDVFEFCWRMVAQDTAAAEAALELEDVPIRVRCRACGTENELPASTIACLGCGSPAVEVVAGASLEIEEVELLGGEVRRNPNLIAGREVRLSPPTPTLPLEGGGREGS
jgi:hydrogenase nickel incorporation protein HypA/HybF